MIAITMTMNLGSCSKYDIMPKNPEKNAQHIPARSFLDYVTMVDTLAMQGVKSIKRAHIHA